MCDCERYWGSEHNYQTQIVDIKRGGIVSLKKNTAATVTEEIIAPVRAPSPTQSIHQATTGALCGASVDAEKLTEMVAESSVSGGTTQIAGGTSTSDQMVQTFGLGSETAVPNTTGAIQDSAQVTSSGGALPANKGRAAPRRELLRLTAFRDEYGDVIANQPICVLDPFLRLKVRFFLAFLYSWTVPHLGVSGSERAPARYPQTEENLSDGVPGCGLVARDGYRPGKAR